MAKSLVFSNGRLHVGLDEHGLVQDLYYPYVGLENQLPLHGTPHKVGIFEASKVSWLDDTAWKTTARYHEKAMVGHTVSTNEELGLRLEFTDAVDVETDTFIRRAHVINLRGDRRELTVYFHQSFMIGDSPSSDSAQYRPDLQAVMHYKGNRVFITSLHCGDVPFDDFSVGKYDTSTDSGTYRDAEDGALAKNTVENGHVDSVLGAHIVLDPFDSSRLDYMLVADETVTGCEEVFQEHMTDGVLHALTRTAAYWEAWRAKALLPMDVLPDTYFQAAEQALFVIKAHLDERGAVMASLDSSLRNHPQDDTYTFCWPRDAVYGLWPLLRLGYTEESIRFFEFIKTVMHDDGYVYHKYRADGSLGSTWLPYIHPDGTVHPPIQADETASVLFLIGQYYRHTNDQTVLTRYYESLAQPMANFLAGHVDTEGLPKPSYDLWEHAYLTHTYTTAITYASLLEAVELAEAYGRDTDADRWRDAAQAMQQASSCLYNADASYFYKGFSRNDQHEKIFDDTIDMSSLFGVFMYGLFDIESDEVHQAILTAQKQLSDKNLYSRFQGDAYYGETSAPNAWPFVSLWMAEIALERDDIAQAESIMNAVLSVAGPSGMLPEQVRRDTHVPASLSPLVWAHAELLSSCLDYIQAKRVASS